MSKKVIVKISDLIKHRGISLRELSRLSDVRHAALSELANGKRANINFAHIEKIADALSISDIREIIDFIDVVEGDEDEHSSQFPTGNIKKLN